MSSHTDRGRPPADGDVSRPIVVTPTFLREWALPTPGGSKYGRGQVLVIGGARGTPGAVMLAGRSALRVGAGRLTMAVAESTAVAVAVAVPESGVVGLPENGQGSVLASVPDQLENACDRADAVLIGSGLDEPEQTAQLLQMILPVLRSSTRVVLDAYALGVLDQLGDTVTALEGRLVLTPNMEEAERLLGGDGTSVDDVAVAVTRIADRYGAVVSCQGRIADADGNLWEISTGHSGLGTSGSGDVLAGAVLGLLGRGAEPQQAACWATHLHAAAGDRLTARVGALGFLAGELVEELPIVLTELNV